MAKLIVASFQNVFNRNYKGSTLYVRNGITLMRRKHITKPLPQNNVVFCSDLLNTAVVDYKSLSSAKKQTFDDFVTLNPEYKSGVNVMAKINIQSNYANKSEFTLIDSINSLAVPSAAPIINITSVSKSNKTVSVSWGPSAVIDTKIDFFYYRSFFVPVSPSYYFGHLIRSDACFYAGTFRVPSLDIYNFINLKAKYTGPENLSSPLSAVVYHSI